MRLRCWLNCEMKYDKRMVVMQTVQLYNLNRNDHDLDRVRVHKYTDSLVTRRSLPDGEKCG